MCTWETDTVAILEDKRGLWFDSGSTVKLHRKVKQDENEGESVTTEESRGKVT